MALQKCAAINSATVPAHHKACDASAPRQKTEKHALDCAVKRVKLNCQDINATKFPLVPSAITQVQREQTSTSVSSAPVTPPPASFAPPLEPITISVPDSAVGKAKRRVNDCAERDSVKRRRRNEVERARFNLEKYAVLPPCGMKCRRKCREKFSEQRRDQIQKHFWSMNFAERRGFLNSHITMQKVHQKKTQSKGKTASMHYSLPKENGEKVIVCKTMFLHSLGMKTDGYVTELKKAMKETCGLPMKSRDNRGRHEPANKGDHNLIKQHIDSFNPQVSHYKRENAPNRRYLDADLSVTVLWQDYVKCFGKISYSAYRKLFDDANIGFGKPSQDKCQRCEMNNVNPHEHSENEHCDICDDLKHHLHEAKEARKAYEDDNQRTWPDDTKVYAVDMQKVIMLPKMNIKEHFFVSRLTVFNETFASLSEKDDICVLWHEGISGRDADDVASAYAQVIRQSDADKFVFWADNCCAQNKNWVLFSSMMFCVNSEFGPIEIQIKYFEKGHTYMRADSVHGSIGKAMKKREEILDWGDFVTVVNNARKSNRVVELTQFYKFTDHHRQGTKKQPMPILRTVREAKFQKGSTSLFYKTSSSDTEFKEVQMLTAKARKCITAAAASHKGSKEVRGINSKKKATILQKLTSHMPPRKREFWSSLPSTDSSADLCLARDSTELQ